jgi:hypothetical protein
MLAHVHDRHVSRMMVLLLLVMCGCFKVNKFSHSPAMAARQAQQFARKAFIERDLTTAYGLLAQNARSDVSYEQFRGEIVKMHPKQYPAFVKAVEYERIPGQKQMNIYLIGEAGDEKFYYRCVMEGTLESGYQVSAVWRNDSPYPPNASVQVLESPVGP